LARLPQLGLSSALRVPPHTPPVPPPPKSRPRAQVGPASKRPGEGAEPLWPRGVAGGGARELVTGAPPTGGRVGGGSDSCCVLCE
jgi:hypothetical protein